MSFHYKGYIYTYTIHMKKLLLTTLIISKVFVHILVNIFSWCLISLSSKIQIWNSQDKTLRKETFYKNIKLLPTTWGSVGVFNAEKTWHGRLHESGENTTKFYKLPWCKGTHNKTYKYNKFTTKVLHNERMLLVHWSSKISKR